MGVGKHQDLAYGSAVQDARNAAVQPLGVHVCECPAWLCFGGDLVTSGREGSNSYRSLWVAVGFCLGAELELELTSQTAVASAPLSGLCKMMCLQKTVHPVREEELLTYSWSLHPCGWWPGCALVMKVPSSAWIWCRIASLGVHVVVPVSLAGW